MEKVFIERAISSKFITDTITKHQCPAKAGAQAMFLGQVQANVIEGNTVTAIEYTAYKSMANQKFNEIRQYAFSEFDLNCIHIYHSLGKVKVGETSLFIFVSSPWRNVAFKALEFSVEEIKAHIPVFGKELFEDGSYQWKVTI